MKINKKLILGVVLVICVLIILAASSVYISRYSKYGIYKNVINKDGYQVFELQKPVNFTTYIEPEWIPIKEGELIKLNKEVGKAGKVKIILESVKHRGNDIYFNFDAKPYIKYKTGEFLYHYIFNKDGTATTYENIDSFHIYNKNDDIEIGQSGIGPDSKFSFGINKEDYDLIKDGFSFEYKSSILYGYSLIED